MILRSEWLFSAVLALSACDGDPGVEVIATDAGTTNDARPRSFDAGKDFGVNRRDALKQSDASQDAPSAAPADEPPLPEHVVRAPAGPFTTELPAPILLVSGRAKLVGEDKTSCSHQTPASADGHRWCAFSRKEEGHTDLWVIDITSAAGSGVSACDGSDARCLRLTQNLWMDPGFAGPAAPWSHHFDGDTLLFYADAVSKPSANFEGLVYAWRPAWKKARQISTKKGFLCEAHRSEPVAFCFDDPAGEGFSLVDVNLRVGLLKDADDLELTDIGRVPAFGNGVGFTNDGRHLAFSSPDPFTGESLLRVIAMDNLNREFPRIILVGAERWQISHDGRAVYYLGPAGELGADLRIADFPTGQNVRRVGQQVKRFKLLGDAAEGIEQGVGFYVSSGTDTSHFRVATDRDRPTQVTEVFSYLEPLEDFHLQADKRFVAYAEFPGDGTFSGFLARLDGSGECKLSDLPNAPAMEVDIPMGSNVAFWLEKNETTRVFPGWISDVSDCGNKRRFAENLAFLRTSGTKTLVFGEDPDDYTFSLKVMPIDGKGPTGAAVRIADWVEYPLFVSENLAMVFALEKVEVARRGLYLFKLKKTSP